MSRKGANPTKRQAPNTNARSREKDRLRPEVAVDIASARSFPIVGIGASAGGFEAFTALLKHLPSNPGMALVLIQHLDPNQPSQLTELLSKTTRMPVLEVKDNTTMELNHIYVMSPAVCLSVVEGQLRAEPRDPGRHLPIDFFLRSLAIEKTSNAIGVVLSGTASDGTLGLKAIKAEGASHS
jgi:two-component system, chemotaxis family, CheB/CheR fusion protein